MLGARRTAEPRASRQVKLSPLELLLGAATAHGQHAPAKYPTAPQPGHDVNAAPSIV